jgi:hypothetical protein
MFNAEVLLSAFLKIAFVASVSFLLLTGTAHAAKQYNKALAPGKAHEECMKMGPNQHLIYSFKATGSLNFNIHYHEDKEVYFPVKQDEIADYNGIYQPTVGHDYCMMWTNTSKKPVSVNYEFEFKIVDAKK